MIQFALGVLLGGLIGTAVTCMSVAANDRTESACAEAFEAGKKAGFEESCAARRVDCPAYERWLERGD